MPLSPCHNDGKKLTIILLISVCVGLCLQYFLFIISSWAEEEINNYAVDSIGSALSNSLVFVWLVWTHTCSCMFLSTGVGSRPWSWHLRMSCHLILVWFFYVCLWKWKTWCVSIHHFCSYLNVKNKNLSQLFLFCLPCSPSAMMSLISNKGKRKQMCVRLINTTTVV